MRSLASHEAEGRALIEAEAVEIEGIEVVNEVDVAYLGQTHPYRIPIPATGFDTVEINRTFDAYFRNRFSIDMVETQAVVTNLRTAVIGRRQRIDLQLLASATSSPAGRPRPHRPVFFNDRWMETVILERDQLQLGVRLGGPAIVQQLDATTLIHPGCDAVIDRLGNLIISTCRSPPQ